MSNDNSQIVNTALLSYGMSGRIFHAPFIHDHPGFILAGSWERSTKKISQAYSSAKSFDSLEQLLDDPTIELVVVNTPTFTHFEYAKKALLHDKHVVVEKAFAGDAEEAAELRDIAAERQCKLAVFQNRRWDSDFLAVQDILNEGVLGDIVEANLAYSRYDPKLSPKAHKEEPSSGSGIVKDLGPHVIDQALVLFGMPDAVFADIASTRETSKVDDYFDILLLYGSKRVHVKGGYFFKQPVPEFTLHGKLGSFLKARADVQEMQLDQGITPDDGAYGREPDGAEGQLFTGGVGNTEIRKVTSPRGNYAAFYAGVFDAIARDGVEPVTAEDGVRVMRIIDAAKRSNSEGRVIRLDSC